MKNAGVLDRWSLIRGSRLREMVANRGWTLFGSRISGLSSCYTHECLFQLFGTTIQKQQVPMRIISLKIKRFQIRTDVFSSSLCTTYQVGMVTR